MPSKIRNLLYKELQKRKIDKRRGSDQIRWGYDNSGNFNIKEASSIKRGDNNMPTDKKWVWLWTQGLWPKITLFIWLLLKGRVLTWDNIRKRGMTGPSKCVLCNKAKETMDQLLNKCKWSRRMWKEGLGSFDQTRRGPGSIQGKLQKWEDKEFKNPIVRHL